ncbi:PDZ domain-containing protein [Gemmatimonadota bacterium]
MDASGLSRYKTPLAVVTVLILIWAVLGALDVRNQTYRGYVTDGNNTITGIDDGGPADLAGLEVGDYIGSIGGIAVEDVRATAARGRATIGEVRTIEVERGGQVVSLDLRYVALTTNAALNYYGGIVVGILFLAFGVWAFLAAPNRATALLAALGISLSPALTVGPYFESASVRTAVGVVVFLVVTAGFAFLTHFLCVFPKKKRALERSNMIWVLYGPAIAVGLLAVWLLVLQPAATSSVNVFFRALFGLFVVAYFGTSLIAMLHSYFKASSRDRAASGLNLLLVGAVIGLGPSIVISIVGLVAPQVVVPGAQFLPLGVGLLPVLFAIAAVRGSRAQQVA